MLMVVMLLYGGRYTWQAAARVVIGYLGLTTHAPIYD